MATIDESRQAFRELRDSLPATISFNGIEKTGISHSISLKRMAHLNGMDVEASSEFELEDADFAELVENGLKDRVSAVTVTTSLGTEELTYMAKDAHPNSATVHMFLGKSN